MRRLGKIGSTLLLTVGVLLGAGLVVPALLGYERYVIVSGSMSGTYDRGSLVLDEVVPVAELRKGDVITYRPPPGAGPVGLVTHRIASIARDERGARVFRTRGDANPRRTRGRSRCPASARPASRPACRGSATASPRCRSAACGCSSSASRRC